MCFVHYLPLGDAADHYICARIVAVVKDLNVFSSDWRHRFHNSKVLPDQGILNKLFI